MEKIIEKYCHTEICPIRNILSRFTNKWGLLILLLLHEREVVRFNELSKCLPDISSKVLSETLKILEADGLVNRTVHPTVPPKVEYSLTDLGQSLIPIIGQLTQWALKNMDNIKKNRAMYGGR